MDKTLPAGAGPVERRVRPGSEAIEYAAKLAEPATQLMRDAVREEARGQELTRLNARQKRMQHAIRYLANYMSTYEQQAGCLDYRDETLIDDVLYGLGYALGGREHQWASGFDVWKAKLRKHLEQKA